MSQDKPKIVVSDVLQMLRDGKTREEIRLHYGLSKQDLKRLFRNEHLKNKKTHAKPGFILEDDISEESPAQESEETTEEGEMPTPNYGYTDDNGDSDSGDEDDRDSDSGDEDDRDSDSGDEDDREIDGIPVG